MLWTMSWRADPEVRPLADRHYNRQKIGAKQFAPPGRALVLKHVLADRTIGAFWITSWPLAAYVKHAWPGAWMCSAFRREAGEARASDLIRDALAVTRWFYGNPPDHGFVTFVDPRKTRAKRDPGYCYRVAGFREVGRTLEDDLVALQLDRERLLAIAPSPPYPDRLRPLEVHHQWSVDR